MQDLAAIAFDHAPVGLIYSEDRIILRCNLRFAEMFGNERDALEGHSLSMLYPSDTEFERIGKLGSEKMVGQ